MARKKRIGRCDLPIYQASIIGLLGWKPKAAQHYAWQKFGMQDDFESDGKCYVLRRNNHIRIIIHLRKFSRSAFDLGLLVHECLHAALLIYEEIGQGCSTLDHEHLTYLVQYIFEQLITNKPRKA